MLFYSASLSAVYGGTDGGANEEATSQFTLRAKCAKRKPTFADKLIIHQSLRHVTITSLPSSMFHLWLCRASRGMGVYSDSLPPDRRPQFRDAKCAATLSWDGWSVGRRRMMVYSLDDCASPSNSASSSASCSLVSSVSSSSSSSSVSSVSSDCSATSSSVRIFTLPL